MYWLGITVLLIATIVFILCYIRLRNNRFLHKIYLHSFNLLSVAYALMYIECIFGIILSCILLFEGILLTLTTIYVLVFVLATTSSMNFIVRVLRQYRIYISTQIEQGNLAYGELIKTKRRLKNSWNLGIGCTYGMCVMVVNFVVLATHMHLKNEEMYSYLTRFLCIEKGIELLSEICCYLRYMRTDIYKVYRIETGILIILQAFLVVFLSTEHLLWLLKYGVLPVQKLSSVVFLDSYILCLLTRECHKKPLLPPICIINSSLYITEIKLVYDSFMQFIKFQNNEEWMLLVNLLMESLIIKNKNSKKITLSFVKTIERHYSDLLEKILNFRFDEYEYEQSLDYLEEFIIDYLDSEAFREFMASVYYKELEVQLKNSNSNILSIAINGSIIK